jgi:hypothetical protein
VLQWLANGVSMLSGNHLMVYPTPSRPTLKTHLQQVGGFQPSSSGEQAKSLDY